MKSTVKKILGDKIVSHMVALKIKWFPNEFQKEIVRKQSVDFNRRKAFYSNFVNHDDVCFDVGANVGNRVEPLLNIGARVVAVEPQESCYRILKQKFGNKIEIVTKGLGEAESVKDFHISNDSTISSFSDEWINSVKEGRFKEYNWDTVVSVEMTTLDKLIEKYGLPVFIKIDVEGYEHEVLKGLTKPVKMISFEYTVPEQVNRALDCIKRIEKNDKNIECNFSIGESMELALQDWKSAEKMCEFVTSKEFINTEFGDIYVRLKSQG